MSAIAAKVETAVAKFMMTYLFLLVLQPNSPELMVLMKANAKFQMKHGDPQQAASLLEEISKKNPKDSHILAQLFSAYSLFDSKKAEQYPFPSEMRIVP